MRVDVLENTDERIYFVIPKNPDQLSDEELDIASAEGQNDVFCSCDFY